MIWPPGRPAKELGWNAPQSFRTVSEPPTLELSGSHILSEPLTLQLEAGSKRWPNALFHGDACPRLDHTRADRMVRQHLKNGLFEIAMRLHLDGKAGSSPGSRTVTHNSV